MYQQNVVGCLLSTNQLANPKENGLASNTFSCVPKSRSIDSDNGLLIIAFRKHMTLEVVKVELKAQLVTISQSMSMLIKHSIPIFRDENNSKNKYVIHVILPG